MPHLALPASVAGISRRAQLVALMALAAATVAGGDARAQAVEVRQWQGQTAATRQPEQVIARTQAEWRSLWTRVGTPAPDLFEPGRMHAVGIFLGPRASGHGVNLISTSRRRDRIVVVFEERGPPTAEALLAQRAAPPPAPARPVSSAPMPAGTTSFAGSGGTAPMPAPQPAPTTASRAPLPPASSPWAIVLINRVDLPISVEQRMYR